MGSVGKYDHELHLPQRVAPAERDHAVELARRDTQAYQGRGGERAPLQVEPRTAPGEQPSQMLRAAARRRPF